MVGGVAITQSSLSVVCLSHPEPFFGRIVRPLGSSAISIIPLSCHSDPNGSLSFVTSKWPAGFSQVLDMASLKLGWLLILLSGLLQSDLSLHASYAPVSAQRCKFSMWPAITLHVHWWWNFNHLRAWVVGICNPPVVEFVIQKKQLMSFVVLRLFYPGSWIFLFLRV